MRKRMRVGAALVLSAALAGCGGGSSSESIAGRGRGSAKPYPELRWGIITFTTPIDFSKNPLQFVSIEQLAVQNLMEFEPDGRVRPALASSVVQPDPTTYVYRLRSVKFSDGRPLTAADVVYSLKRNMIGKEVWTKTYWEDVSSIASRGDSTVVVKLKRPSAIFQDVLAFSGQVIEKAQAERVGEKALGTPGNLPIGTGPWKLDSYKPEAEVRLSRNPYWTGAPQPAQRITVSLFKDEASLALALRSGAIDGTFGYLSPKIFAGIPGIRRLTAPGTSSTIIGVNTTSPPFNDVHVRRAIAYATNTRGMINAIYPAGTAIEDQTIVPASLFAALGTSSQVSKTLDQLPKYNFDLAAAKRELVKSAYPHGFTTKIETEATSSSLVLIAQVLSADLAKIGITAKVDELQPDEASVVYNGKVRMVVTESYAVYADPEGIMSSNLAPSQIHPPGSGVNFANYRNPEVDRLLSEEIRTPNATRRLQLIGKLLGVTGSDAPYWPVYTHATLGALSEKYVWSTFSQWTSFYAPWALDVKSRT